MKQSDSFNSIYVLNFSRFYLAYVVLLSFMFYLYIHIFFSFLFLKTKEILLETEKNNDGREQQKIKKT